MTERQVKTVGPRLIPLIFMVSWYGMWYLFFLSQAVEPGIYMHFKGRCFSHKFEEMEMSVDFQSVGFVQAIILLIDKFLLAEGG